MCGALKILVCVASILAVTLASNGRKKRDDYDTLVDNPWRSPTSYGFRPNNNYNSIPTTKILRVNNYNPYQNGRSIQGNQGSNINLYSTREQNSDWVPIIHNRNQQYNGVRYGQNGQQNQGVNSYNNIRNYPSINLEQQSLNQRTRQRQPNYSVQSRGRPINPQILREINGKLLIQSNRYPAQQQVLKNIYQGQRPNVYPRQLGNIANNGINQLPSRQIPIQYGRQVQWRENIHRDNQETLVRLPIDLNQDSLRDILTPNELPAIEGRILGLNVQQVEPVKSPVQNNAELNRQNLRDINLEHLVRSNQLPVVQGQILGETIQRPSGYAVKEITEPEDVSIQQQLRLQSNQLAEQNNAQQEISSNQDINEPTVQLKQILRVINPGNLIRSEEIQEPRVDYSRVNIQQNIPSNYLRQRIAPIDNGARYPNTLALIKSNQAYRPVDTLPVQGPIIGDTSRPQLIEESVRNLNQLRPQEVKVIIPNGDLNNNIRFSQQLNTEQAPNNVWRQGRISDQLNGVRNNDVSNLDDLSAQQEVNQNGDIAQPNVYSYAELTAKIWKVLKSNPSMMSNLNELRDQLLNERNSKNDQIRELRSLLEEARKYNRNSAINSGAQTSEQKQRNAVINNIIDIMNQNEGSSDQADLSRKLTYLDNGSQRQGRYRVRPADVNPLIKNILFATNQRNETQAENTPSVQTQGIVVRPNTNIPLPQLEIAEPFSLDQLEHHYDLSNWKQATELLKGNPFLQSYNVLEHLV